MQNDMAVPARGVGRFKPSLLLFAAFLSSVAIFTPNMRVLKRCVCNQGIVDAFFLSMIVSCAALALVLAVRAMRVRAFPLSRAGIAVAATAYSAVQVALVVLAMQVELGSGPLPMAAAVALGVASAASSGVVVAAWIRAFDADFRGVMLSGALVCAVCAALVWLLSCAPDAVVIVAMPVLAAMGSFGVLVVLRDGRDGVAREGMPSPADHAISSEESMGFRKSLANLLSVIWLPLLGLLLCVFMMNVYSIDAAGTSVSECTGCLIASALAFVLCVACKKTPLVVAVDKLVLPACAAVSIVFGAFPMGTPLFLAGAYSVYAPLVFISIYALASILLASRSGEFPPALAFGTLVFAASVVALAGFAAACALGPDPMTHGAMLWVVLCVYFGIVMLNLGWSSWKQAVRPLADAAADAAPSDASQAPAEDLLDRLHAERVAQLSDEYGLTARETELLDYMSRGHNSSYIAQVLFISPSTVRTHFRNIYRKLGVGSREELLALFNASASEDALNARIV